MDPGNLALHAEGLRALARRLVNDAAAADDVVQEACLAALRRGTASRPWLVGVVRNLARRRHREESRRAERERRAARPEAAPADEAVERAELHRALLDELLALEEPYRAAMLLRHVDGLSHGEIARRLRVPPGTVSARLHRGLELLRGRLDRRFGGRVSWCLLFLPFFARPSAAAWGALLVSTKKTVSLAALLLLALAALVLTLSNRTGGAPGARSARNAAAPADAPAQEPEASAPAAVDLNAVDRDLDLHGVVVDARGAPIAGARVEAFWFPWQRGSLGTGDLLQEEACGPGATTALDGTFALRLARGQQVNLRTSAQGFATSELAAFQAGERARIVLGAGVRVVFECVDEGGKGVPGAEVRLSRGEDESPGRNFVERRGDTGADGRCVFDGLPAGEWAYLWATHGRRADVWRRARFPVSGGSVERIVLAEGRTLRGTVRDAGSGAPIPGARVGASWTLREHVLTDAEGRYEFQGFGLEGSMEDLGAAAEGYAREAARVGPADVYDFALARGCDLTGRIVGAGGGPVPGALLCVRGRGADSGLPTYVHGVSGADGTFRIRGIACGIVNTLTAVAPGHGRYLLDFASPAEVEPIDLGEVALPAARSVEGRVVFDDGAAAPGVLIALEGWNADRGRLIPGASPGFRTGAEREERRTDDLGRFRFRDLAPGSYTLTCATPGYKPLPLDVTVPDDADATGIELRLAGGHDLVVRLVEVGAGPVANMFVRVQLADDWWLQAGSDANGIARFRADAAFESVEVWDFEPGRYRIPPPRPLPSGTDDVTIELDRAGVAMGIVLGIDGRPLPQAALRIVSLGENVEQGAGTAFSDLEGKFRVVVPARGTAEIILTGIVNRMEGNHTGEIPPFGGRLEGVAAGAKDLVLRARPLTFDRALSVRVLAPDGSPLGGAQVFARDMAGAVVPGANVLTDALGLAVLKALPDGDIGVWAKAVRRPGAEDWMDAFLYPLLAEGQAVTLRMREGLRVRGEVTSADGEPVADAYVTAYRRTDMLRTVQTDASGIFSLLVPADTAMPLRLIAQKWEGKKLLQAAFDAWTPERGDVAMFLAPGR